MHPRSFAPTTVLFAATLFAGAAEAQAVLATLDGLIVDDAYGASVANAFDVDGDGVDDLITGAPDFSSGGGRVEIRSGRTTALIRSWTGVTGGGEQYGARVAGIGDVDGDGLSEVAFTRGDVYSGQGNARVSVRRGSDGSELYQVLGNGDDWFANSIAGGGDSDGDGLPELLIGVPFGGSFGRVLRVDFSSSPPTLDVWTGHSGNPAFGLALHWVGDVDADGLDEFSAQIPTGDPKVGIYGESAVLQWSRTISGATGYGAAVANVGDQSFDGLPDLAIGAPYRDSGSLQDAGYVEVVSGATGAFLYARFGTGEDDRFGQTLGGVGDVDGDGRGDLVVGAPQDGTPNFGVGFLDPGEVHVLSGADLSTISTQRGVGNHGHLGASLAVLDDVNGDGAKEFVAGAPFPLTTATDEPGSLWFFDPADHVARCQSLGAPTAGTLGPPILACVGAPRLGSTMSFTLSNTSGQPTTAALVAGRTDASVPFLGGVLHLVPTIVELLPTHPAAGSTVPLAIPQDHAYAGVRWLVQGLQLDAGAPGGVSFSNAVAIEYGGF